MFYRFIFASALLAFVISQNPANNTQTACHEVFSNCAACDIQQTVCLQCNSGYFRLQTKPEDPSRSLCVLDCSLYNSHVPDYQSRQCQLDCPDECGSRMCASDQSCSSPSAQCSDSYSFLTPDQECSQFACPHGFYRNALDKSCGHCDSSCATCSGPASNQCLSCSSESYLSQASPSVIHGECLRKNNQTQDSVILVSNAVSIIENGKAPSMRTGQINNPFIDLRDAIHRGQELVAPFQNGSVTIFLTKGTHYILLEEESLRYRASLAHQHETSYSLTIKPLPCAIYPSLESACVAPNETVEVINKIGAFLHFDFPQSTSIERIHFDFADSLLEWGSSCQKRRTRSCSVEIDGLDNTLVTSLDPDCACGTASIQASTCNYKHELSFLTTPVPQGALAELTLTQVKIRNVFEHFNSIIGFNPEAPPNLVVQESNFNSISLCGPIISSTHPPPQDPNDLLSLSFNKPLAAPSSLNGATIKIIGSSFQEIGLTLIYQDAYSLKASTYKNYLHDAIATVLELESIAASIEIRGSLFSDHKLNYDPLLPIDPTQTILFQNSLLLQKGSLIEQGLIVVKNHTQGILLEGNTFERNSGLRGLIVIETAASYEKGAVIYNNTFSQSSGLIRAGVLNLRSRYLENAVHSCSGFHVERNTIVRTVLLKNDAAVFYMSCVYDDFIHFDDLQEISGIEYLTYPASKVLPPMPSVEESYQINDQILMVDFNQTVVRNNTIAENLRAKNCGSMVVVLFMRSLLIEDLSLVRNGDLNLMKAYEDSTAMWRKFGGLHNSLRIRNLSVDQIHGQICQGFQDKLLFLGSIDKLLVDGVYAYDNWFKQVEQDSYGRFITMLHSDGLIREVEAVSFQSQENQALFGFIKSEHPPESLAFQSAFGQLSSPLLEGPLFYSSSCLFQSIFVKNLQLSEAVFSSLPGNTCYLQGISLLNVKMQRLVAKIRPSAVYLSKSTFRICEFDYMFETPYGQFTEFLYSNRELKIDRPVTNHFDYMSSELFIFRDTTFDTICGNSQCRRDLFIANINGRFEFYNLTVNNFYGKSTSILRVMGGSMFVKDSHFEANQAPFGVAVKFVGSGVVEIENSYFVDNRGQASSLFAMSAQASLTVRKSTLESNKAVNGGAIIGFSGQGHFLFQDCLFIQNQAMSGSILQGLSDDLTVQNTFRNCSFTQNTGAATFYAFVMNIIIDGCHFADNIDLEGHSSPLYISGSRMKIKDTFFSNNGLSDCTQHSVNRGGFLYDVTGNDVSISGCVFEEVCASDGGAIFLSGISKTSIKSTTFRRCSSLEGGGAIHAKNFAKLQIVDSLFQENSATLGADIFALDSSHLVAILNSKFKKSGSGSIYLSKTGANITNSSFSQLALSPLHSVICSFSTKDLQIRNNSFIQIEAGSAIQLHSRASGYFAKATIEQNLFSDITGWANGGAVQAIQSGELTMQLNQFTRVNLVLEEGKGGALYIDQSSDHPVSIMENRFEDCSADMSGAIQWIQREPIIIDNHFQQTQAKFYAPSVGSYGKEILFIPTQIGEVLFTGYRQVFSLQGESRISFEGLRSGGQLPIVYAGVMDQYNQIVTNSQGGVVYSSVREVLKGGQTQSEYTPLLSDTNQNIWTNGVMRIEHLKLIGEPGRTYQVLFTSPIIDTSLPAVQSFMSQNNFSKIQISLEVTFRECQSGEEFLPEGECRKCPSSYYLLEAPRAPTSCKPCLQNAVCFGGNQIGPVQGYWRSHSMSETISPCFNFDGCLGTFPDDEYETTGTCGKGYTGKLCGTCKLGYTRNTRYQCNKCPEPLANFLILMALLILFAFIFIVAIKCSLRAALKKKSLFTVYFKILVNHLQVLMLISSFDFDWPSEVQDFLAASKTVTDSPQELFSIDCLVQSSIGRPFKRFYIYSLIYFFLPLICATFSFLFWRVKYWQSTRKMCNKLIATLFIIFFLIHPSVTRVILQLFDCHGIDGTPYLKEELSEQCWQGDQLRFSMTVGLLGIALWSVGIPILSAFLLRRNHKKLEEPAVKEKFGFLYNGYASHSYYWEAFMSLRKVLIAFISIFLTAEGTMLQSLVLFVVLIVSIFINFKVNPFNERKINRLEIVSLIALIVTVYCGIFFLSARNPQKMEYIRGKDFTLSQTKKWLLFFAIILSNGFFAGLWVFRLVLEVKNKLLTKFPSCYRFFCLCCNRRRLMREQQVAASSEKNQDLILRLKSIQSELGSYIDKLERNENLIELNILDELANDIKNTLGHISNWRDYQQNLKKESSKFKMGNLKLDFKADDLRSDEDTIESALSTRRPLNTNQTALPLTKNSSPSLQIKNQITSFKKLTQISGISPISLDNIEESMKSETQSLEASITSEKESQRNQDISPRKERRPSLFQKISLNTLISREFGQNAGNKLDDDRLDLEYLEEEFKIREVNKERECTPPLRTYTPWSQFIQASSIHQIDPAGGGHSSKVKRRKSNFDSGIALFTKLDVDKDDSF